MKDMQTCELELGGNVGTVIVPCGFEEIGKAIYRYNQTVRSELSWNCPRDAFERNMQTSCHESAIKQRSKIEAMLKAKPEFQDFASGVVFWFRVGHG